MKKKDIILTASDGKNIYVNRWIPDRDVRGVLVIAHGMSEHGLRYVNCAEALTIRGWAVIAPDHRGHGKTAAEGELGWFAEHDGFRRVVDDIREIAVAMQTEYDGVPVAIFGHCMGSLIALAYAGLYGKDLAACAVTGIIDAPSQTQTAAGRIFSAMGCLVMGQMTKANALDGIMYRSNNRRFEPARTALDWLSRDQEEVDAHFADPLCGFVCSYGFFRDLFAGFDMVYGSSGVLKDIPTSLPVLLAAGGDDPIGGARGAVQKHERRLRAIGVKRVDTRMYPGARHELLRETNRDQVIADLVAWLAEVVSLTPRPVIGARADRMHARGAGRGLARERRR